MTSSQSPPQYQPGPVRDPFSDSPEVLLLAGGPAPQLRFRGRGVDDLWRASLDALISRHNAPRISTEALLVLGPWLVKAGEEAEAHLSHRQQTRYALSALNEPQFTTYFQYLPTPALRRVRDSVLAFARKFLAVDLIRRWFPQVLPSIRPDEAWHITALRFLQLVRRADWFPLDWDAINSAMLEIERGETDGDFWLSDFLEVVPLPPFAPTESAYASEKHRVLYGLFANSYTLNVADLQPYGIQNAPGSIDDDQIYRALIALQPEDTLSFPYPLNFLPEVAQVYRRDTGFSMLDIPEDGQHAPYAPNYFSWETDVYTLRRQWHENGARALIDQVNAFHAWIEDDAKFDQAVITILQVGGYLPYEKGGVV